MLLAFDVGNTNTLIGLCRISGPAIDHASILATWRVSSSATRLPDEWYALLDPLLRTCGATVDQISAVVIGSVVPDVRRWLADMCRSRLQLDPIVVSAALDTGIRVATERPLATGADRIANAVAALAIAGAPSIVVDFGTATNIEVIDRDGDLIGGAIAPGAALVLDALTSRAAQLSAVPMRFPPTRGIGRDTTAAVQSGSVAGYLDLIEGTVRRIREELGVDAPVLTTGGLAGVFVAASDVLRAHEPLLTLLGLRAIALRQDGVVEDRRRPARETVSANGDFAVSDVLLIQ